MGLSWLTPAAREQMLPHEIADLIRKQDQLINSDLLPIGMPTSQFSQVGAVRTISRSSSKEETILALDAAGP